MQFRLHKGSISESMRTVKFVENKSDIAKIFNDTFNANIIGDDLIVKKYAYDHRINWDTYIVTHKGSVVGFCDGNINN